MSNITKRNRMVKIFSAILVISMVLFTANMVFASDPFDNIKPNYTGTEGVTNIGNTIIGIVTVVGMVASVLVLVVLGIKYMMGSAEEKAEYKKTMIPYLIGAILVFAASAIAGIIRSIATQGFNSATP